MCFKIWSGPVSIVFQYRIIVFYREDQLDAPASVRS